MYVTPTCVCGHHVTLKSLLFDASQHGFHPPHPIYHSSTSTSPAQTSVMIRHSADSALLSNCSHCIICCTYLVLYVPCVAGTDQRFKRLRVDGVNIGVSVWDTAGQDRFQSLTPMYYRGAQGVVYGEWLTMPQTAGGQCVPQSIHQPSYECAVSCVVCLGRPATCNVVQTPYTCCALRHAVPRCAVLCCAEPC